MASQMKSAGNWSRKRSTLRWGKPHWAKGMLPESNQQSMTSGTRRIVPSHRSQDQVMASTQGRWICRCRSTSRAIPSGDFATIASMEAGASACSQASQIQMLSGVPQNRSRDSAQSTLLRRKSPKRPSLRCSGSQCTAWLLSSASRLRLVVRTNHAGRAYWMSGSSSARQQNG